MTYWILVDLALIALIICCVYLGLTKGFVKVMLLLLAIGISCGAAFMLTKWTAGGLSNAVFAPWAEKTIAKYIDKSENSEELYDYLDRGMSTLDKMAEKIKEKLSGGEEDGAQTAETAVNDSAQTESSEETPLKRIAKLIGVAIAGTILFIIFFAAVLALCRTGIEYLTFIDRIPIVGFANRVLGTLLGLALGFGILAAPLYVIQKLLSSSLASLGIGTGTLAGSRVLEIVIRMIS